MYTPGVMVTVSCSITERQPPLWTNVTLHTLVPKALAAGVHDTMPALVTLGGAANMAKLALLLHATENVSLLLALAGPVVMAVAQLILT
jgi:hypothetical protein